MDAKLDRLLEGRRQQHDAETDAMPEQLSKISQKVDEMAKVVSTLAKRAPRRPGSDTCVQMCFPQEQAPLNSGPTDHTFRILAGTQLCHSTDLGTASITATLRT